MTIVCRSSFIALSVAFAFQGQAMAGTLYETPMFNVQETSNVVYGSGLVNGSISKSLTLDVYQPTKVVTPVPANTPAIVLVHGGGFISGDKTDLTLLADEYASLG